RAGALGPGTRQTMLVIALFLGVTVGYEGARWVFPHYTGSRSSRRTKISLYLATLSAGYGLRGYVALAAGFKTVPGHWSGQVLFSMGAGLLGAVVVVISLSDVALMISQHR